jgi:hypothetical protein
MGRRGRFLVVAKVDVDRLRRRRNGGGELFVGRLAATEVTKRCRMVDVSHADGACLGESRLDPVPGGMLEVEREP